MQKIIFFFFKNQILGKSIRVDHVQDYKPPKDDDRYDDLTRKLHTEGCAPKIGDPQYIRPEMPVKREKSPAKRDRSPTRRDMRDRRDRSSDREYMRNRSPLRRDIKLERSPNRRNESPIRSDIKREESRASNRDRSPRRRSNSNERRRRNSSSDGKVNHCSLIKIHSLSFSLFSKKLWEILFDWDF